MYPHLSESTLLQDLQDIRALHMSPRNGWPRWMQHDPATLLAKKRFVVCGSTCRSEIRVLAKHAQVVAIVDDAMASQGKRIFGINVIDTDTWADLARQDDDIVSCILTPSTRGYQHFSKIAMQWSLQVLYPLQYLHLLKACQISKLGEAGRFFWYGEEFFSRTLNHLDHLIELRTHLADDYSRFSWLCVLAYRMTLNPFYLDACAVGHSYEKFTLNTCDANRQFFQFTEEEVYVDGGSFTGYTIASFLNAVNNKFRHVHAFEPSSDNHRQIRQLLRKLSDDSLHPLMSRVTLHEKGLWDSNTVLSFNPSYAADTFGDGEIVLPASAHLVDSNLIGHIHNKDAEEQSAIKVPVTTIDSATDRSATYIKLEIEGSELQALHGARETIARNHPKMAIAIYHKPEDLETLTRFVLEEGQSAGPYRLGFRAHNPHSPDAMVLYCY